MDVDLTKDTFQSNKNEASEESGENTMPEKSGEIDTSCIHNFTERTWKEDFALIVEKRKLFVAKNILALVSPVFENMFQSDFKEKGMDELELPGKKFDDVLDFLRCVYPGVIVNVSLDNVYRLLPLAEEYQVSFLKSKCEQFLINYVKDVSIDEVYDILGQACTYNMEDLVKKCIELASEKSIANFDCALERMSLPLNVANDIKDKMVRRHEQDVWYKDAYMFLLSGMKREDKLAIEKYKGWTSITLHFPLTESEMISSNPPQSKFILFDTDVTYSVKYTLVYNNYCISLQFSVEENKLRGWTISLYGRLVLKCGTPKNEDFTGTFDMSFEDGITVQSGNIYGSKSSASYIFNSTEGFIHNGKLDAEIYLLATRQKSE